MKRTKIVVTLGPASSSAEVIEGMIQAGADLAHADTPIYLYLYSSSDDYNWSPVPLNTDFFVVSRPSLTAALLFTKLRTFALETYWQT